MTKAHFILFLHAIYLRDIALRSSNGKEIVSYDGHRSFFSVLDGIISAIMLNGVISVYLNWIDFCKVTFDSSLKEKRISSIHVFLIRECLV